MVRSRCTYVAVWPAWIGFGGLWAPDSEDSGSAAFAQRVHPAEQFRAERGEAEDVDSWTRSDRGNARRERPRGSKRPKPL